MDSNLIQELDSRWTHSSKIVRGLLEEHWISDSLAPLNTWISNSRREKRVIFLGICGPGASGKTTFLNYICENCGFKQLLNVTTRDPRNGEKDGVDYHFVDYDTFLHYNDEEKFEVTVEKSGRGFYGILKEDVMTCLISNHDIAIIQSPLVLSHLFHLLVHKTEYNGFMVSSAILYFIPKAPIVSNLIEFLSKRQNCIKEESIMIEHGWRQIEEFSSLLSINGEETQVFVVEGYDPIQLGKRIKISIDSRTV